VATKHRTTGVRRLASGGVLIASYVAAAVLFIVGAELSGMAAGILVAVLAAYLGASALIGAPWTYRLAVGPWVVVAAFVAYLDAEGFECSNCSGSIWGPMFVLAMVGFVTVIALGPLIALRRAVRHLRGSAEKREGSRQGN
jgi:hypothetical protein